MSHGPRAAVQLRRPRAPLARAAVSLARRTSRLPDEAGLPHRRDAPRPLPGGLPPPDGRARPAPQGQPRPLLRRLRLQRPGPSPRRAHASCPCAAPGSFLPHGTRAVRPRQPRRPIPWAELLKRTFQTDVSPALAAKARGASWPSSFAPSASASAPARPRPRNQRAGFGATVCKSDRTPRADAPPLSPRRGACARSCARRRGSGRGCASVRRQATSQRGQDRSSQGAERFG